MPIQFDPRDLLEGGKVAVPFGRTGTGKTRDIAISCPNMVWLTAKEDSLLSYATWLRTKTNQEHVKKFGLRLWDRLPLTLPDPIPSGYDAVQELKNTCTEVEQAISKGEIQASGIVVDEYSEFLRRRHGDGGDWTQIPIVAGDNRWFASFAERTGLWLILICHEAQPRYDTAVQAFGKDGKESFKKKGECSELGGPAIPYAKERASFVSQVSFAPRRIAVQTGEGVQYYWVTKPLNNFYCKMRGDDIAAKDVKPFGDLIRLNGMSFPTYGGTDKDGFLKIVAPDPFLAKA